MTFTVTCEDGLVRHREPFATRTDAETFAEWGHCCTRRHDITETDTCSWQVRVSINDLCPPTCECEGAHGEMFAEARGEMTRECGAPMHFTDRGWHCDAGHEHVNMESRHREGWDYFDDDEINAARNGTFMPAVAMRTMSGNEVL